MLYELHWQRRSGVSGKGRALPDYDRVQALADRMNLKTCLRYPVAVYWWVVAVKQCAVTFDGQRCLNVAAHDVTPSVGDALPICAQHFTEIARIAQPYQHIYASTMTRDEAHLVTISLNADGSMGGDWVYGKR
jgi:hypothetical protein